MNMQSGMVVVLENGFNSSMDFMKEIQKKGIANNLKGWWWSSDKGLIRDPEESDEMVVKAQTMYDAMTGKPVYVNGVRMFQTHSPAEIRNMINVYQHDMLAVNETNKSEHPTLPPRDLEPLPLRTVSDRSDPNLGKPEQPADVEFPPLTETVGNNETVIERKSLRMSIETHQIEFWKDLSRLSKERLGGPTLKNVGVGVCVAMVLIILLFVIYSHL